MIYMSFNPVPAGGVTDKALRNEQSTVKEALAGGCRELPLPEEEMQNFRQLVQPLYRKYCADYLTLVEEIQAE